MCLVNSSAAKSSHVGFWRSISQIFFTSAPTFELFLAVNGFEHLIERLVMDQSMTAVFLAEAIHQVILVFIDASL
jgi:hypothetical protein